MGLQAAEQLVTHLAANRLGTDLKPTKDQEELNIPRFLVYLLGIVIAEDEYQRWKEPQPSQNDSENSYCFSLAREKRFAAFQKQYWASVNQASVHSDEQKLWISSSLASNPYKLSTRVYPSKEQKAIVKRDLLNECERLESISNAALASLLEEESFSCAMSAKKRRKGKKKKKKQSKEQKQVNSTGEVRSSVDITVEETSCTDIRRRDDGNETDNTSSRDSISDSKNKSVVDHTAVGDDFEDECWNKTERGQLKNSTNDNRSNPQHSNHESKGSPPADADVHQIGTNIESMSSSLIALDSNSLLVSNVCSKSSHHAVTNDLELTKETERIARLEREVLEANSQLSKERLAHAKILRQEKERFENMIQALQLRLYISENKLRTYEEALENHVQAVSTVSRNKSIANDSNINERNPSSPSLISKVLENKKNGKMADHIW